MEKDHAMASLGVNAGASPMEIEAAYRRLVEETRECYAGGDKEEREAYERALKWLEEARDSLMSNVTPAQPKLPPLFAGRFERQRELGSGQTGTVWLARDSRRECLVVLKFLPGEVSQDKNRLEVLKRKTHSSTELNHPNIARVYDFVEEGGRSAISMEYVDGPSLSQMRLDKPNQIFEADDLKVWVRELCEAVDHAHQHSQFLHELKPGSLRVDRAGHLKLSEIDITRLVNGAADSPRPPGEPGETPGDDGPREETFHEKAEAAGAVHALGMTLYELLTGTPPFPLMESGIRDSPPSSMAARRTERGVTGEAIPENWERTVAACLAKAPEHRPRSVLKALRMLESPPTEPRPCKSIDAFNWRYVFASRDEGGLQAGPGEEWPAVAADFLSPKAVVALRSGETSNALEQAEIAEHLQRKSWRHPGSNLPEQNQRFITIGIRRLTIPEAEIREYLAYRFARQTALQLRFNHWNDSRGFLSESRPFDFGEQVRQQATLERWLLTDDHLQLSHGILPEETADGNWKSLIQDWVDVMPRLAVLAERHSTKADWPAELEKLSSQRYDETFRGLGVKGFYARAASQAGYARFISARIERELFTDWRAGAKSMFDVTRALEALRVFLKERLATMGTQIAAHEEQEERARGLVQANREAYARIGRFDLFLHRRRSLLNAHMGYLRSLHLHRTFVEACAFERLLLQELIAEVARLSSDAQLAATLVNAGTAHIEAQAAERCDGDPMADLGGALGRVYNNARVHEFGKRLDKDKGEQERHAQAVRTALAAEAAPGPTFSRMAGIGRQRVLNLIERECEASARKVHEDAIAVSRDANPLAGGNILSHLEREFSGRTDDLREFIHELVDGVRQFLESDDNEGSDVEAFAPTRVQRRVVIIPAMPESGTFEVIKELIRQRFSRGARLDFVENAKNAGEITFVSVTSPFTSR